MTTLLPCPWPNCEKPLHTFDDDVRGPRVVCWTHTDDMSPEQWNSRRATGEMPWRVANLINLLKEQMRMSVRLPGPVNPMWPRIAQEIAAVESLYPRAGQEEK